MACIDLILNAGVLQEQQPFVFGIPEGTEVDDAPRRSQRVSRTPARYKNYDTSGGDEDMSPVLKKNISPRDRKRRHADARHRAKGGSADILQEEEEG